MASNIDLGLNIPEATSTTGTRVYDPDKQRTPSAELGKDEFLKVLVAQMSNQNPLEPTSDTEFIAQMAQFSALEQMQNMNNAIQSQRAYSMIGKEITATSVVDSEGNAYAMDVYGKVTGISKLKGVEYLVVYDYVNDFEVLVPPDSVRTTFDSVNVNDQMTSIYTLLKDLLTLTQNLYSKIEDGTLASSSWNNSTNTGGTGGTGGTDGTGGTGGTDETGGTGGTGDTDETGGTGDTDETGGTGGTDETGGEGDGGASGDELI